MRSFGLGMPIRSATTSWRVATLFLKKKKVKQVGPKHAKRQSRTTFRVGQRVWYTHNKKRLDATVTGVDKQDKTADVRYNQGGWKVNLDVPFKDLRPHYGD